MKIKNKVLYINKIDLDHILGTSDWEESLEVPPTELFKEGLRTELELNGLQDETFKDIVIKDIWGD